jgi:AcrR family transcriptional regulator
VSASDAPQRAPGLRTRSGNAMLRTRSAILDAAAASVASSGVRRTTMSDIATTGGVAKATLYNHFRTKDDVLAALVEARVSALGAACEAIAGSAGLASALEQAAAELAAFPALRRVAADEPALLVPLSALEEGRTAESARAAVAAVLVAAGAASGAAQVELVLRWLAGQLLAPLEPQAAAAQAALLVSAVSPAGASAVPAQGTPEARAHAAGLGWPGGPDRLRTR